MDKNLRKQLVKYAKQDLKTVDRRGSIIVCQCKIDGKTVNLTISRNGYQKYDFSWFSGYINPESGQPECNFHINASKEDTIEFLVNSYDVEVEAKKLEPMSDDLRAAIYGI